MSAGDVLDIQSVEGIRSIDRSSRAVARDGIPGAMLHEDTVREVLWHYGLAGGREPGHFRAALMSTFQRADVDNFRILREAYPVLGFWMYALRFSTDGHRLALRALSQMGLRP